MTEPQKYWLTEKPIIYDITSKTGLAFMMAGTYQVIK